MRFAKLVALASLTGLAGCGSGGSGLLQDVITPANEAQFSKDAKILTVRATKGTPWLSTATTAAFDADLSRIRAAYPEVNEIHAVPKYVLNEIEIEVAADSPWIERWMVGILPTGDSSVDRLLRKYGAVKIKGRRGPGPVLGFTITVAQSLKIGALTLEEFQRASGRFTFGGSDGVGFGGDPQDIALDPRSSPKRYGFTRVPQESDVHTLEFTLQDNGTITKREYPGYPPYGFPDNRAAQDSPSQVRYIHPVRKGR